ncbi:hypothetical protein V5799_014163, partial [Amblyomma americanum]
MDPSGCEDSGTTAASRSALCAQGGASSAGRAARNRALHTACSGGHFFGRCPPKHPEAVGTLLRPLTLFASFDLKMMHELGGLDHFCGLEDHILQPGVLPLVAMSSAGDRVVAAFAAWVAFDSSPPSVSAAHKILTDAHALVTGHKRDYIVNLVNWFLSPAAVKRLIGSAPATGIDNLFIAPEASCALVSSCPQTFQTRGLKNFEEELRRFKEFHAKNKPILMKVERREALWARFLEFEKRAADPSRLTIRGGRLLLEMRKRLETELPR